MLLAMATLHVRNFPDPLYDALRAAAEENGRSIAAMSVALLNESLSTGRRGFPFFRRRGPEATPLQSFGEEARGAVVRAEALARELGHTQLGTDALLLALAEGRDLALVAADAVRARVERGPGTPEGTVPFGPDTKEALELALRESLKARCAAIEPIHLLLGIAGAAGPGARILTELELGPAELRTTTIDDTIAARSSTARVREYRVVELQGTAADWEEELLDVSGRGYELAEIVGTRAILRLRRP
jgi:ATP-dependent Clp protease ATP-binding subunit ClpC